MRLSSNVNELNNKNDNGSNEMITEFGDLTRNIQSTILKDVEISILDEKKAGNSYVKDLRKEKRFIDKGSDYKKLNKIMKDLISRLAKPRGIDYEMFFVDDKLKNVFTLGGNIIFYKGMYDFCKNDSEIAAIISHEIAHNELGHSTLKLKKQKKRYTVILLLGNVFRCLDIHLDRIRWTISKLFVVTNL